MAKEPLHNERTLMQQLAAGDKAAYQAIFDHYWEQVYSAALRMTKSPEQSKDLAQDIFFKLWVNRHRLTELDQLSNYLFIISRNTVYDHLRNKVFRESNKVFLEQYFHYTQHSPQEIIEQKELDKRVLDAIDRLPPQLRQVFQLHRLEGLSHEEIARRMNITPMSSKTYMVRALAFLREQLGSDHGKLLILLEITWKYFRM